MKRPGLPLPRPRVRLRPGVFGAFVALARATLLAAAIVSTETFFLLFTVVWAPGAFPEAVLGTSGSGLLPKTYQSNNAM